MNQAIETEPAPLDYAYGKMASHLAATTNPVIFEMGMCDGYHTQMLNSFCTTTPRYFGFEPDPRNVARIKAAGVDRMIAFHPDAVGHVTGRIPFHLSTPEPNGAVGASSISDFTPVLTQSWAWLKHMADVEVQCWRLDDFCSANRIDRIDFIWMDVQGAERLVFDGAPVMLQKTRMIWTEYDGGTLYKDSSTLQDILARFKGWQVVCDCGGDVLLRNPNACLTA